MDALKTEIQVASSKKSVDSGMCDLLLKVLNEIEKRPVESANAVTPARGPRGEPGPRGPEGPQGPAGVCLCKCTATPTEEKKIVRKKKVTTPAE
jgi:hypothetical protein